MTAPPGPRSVTGFDPVPTWKLTGIPCACAAAQIGSYAGELYGCPSGASIGSMIERSPRPATRSISATAGSISCTAIIAAPANRDDWAANVSASQSLYARQLAHRSSGSGIMNPNSAIVG